MGKTADTRLVPSCAHLSFLVPRVSPAPRSTIFKSFVTFGSVRTAVVFARNDSDVIFVTVLIVTEDTRCLQKGTLYFPCFPFSLVRHDYCYFSYSQYKISETVGLKHLGKRKRKLPAE